MPPVLELVGLRYLWVIQGKGAERWLAACVWAPFAIPWRSGGADVMAPDEPTQGMCTVRGVEDGAVSSRGQHGP